jgi:hypothetical protein
MRGSPYNEGSDLNDHPGDHPSQTPLRFVRGAAVLLLDRLRDPKPAAALDPIDVVLGGSNTESTPTIIKNSALNGSALILEGGPGAAALRAVAGFDTRTTRESVFREMAGRAALGSRV